MVKPASGLPCATGSRCVSDQHCIAVTL